MTRQVAVGTLWLVHRLDYIAILMGILLAAAGCGTPLGEDAAPIWEQVKIWDLGPPASHPPRRAQVMGTIHFDVYAFDLPADNIERLGPVWQTLSAKPIHTNSYTAFAENGFRVRYGRLRVWKELEAMLAKAGGRGAGTTSLILSEEAPANLPIADVPQGHPISFVGTDLSRQIANVGPGVLVLRLRAQPVPGARGVRKMIAYPVHTLPSSLAIPELDAAARQREFYFGAAAFASQMSPGDFVLLAPNDYTGQRDTLGGLFFNKPVGTVFLDPEHKRPPERKPTVRIFVLICTRMTD